LAYTQIVHILQLKLVQAVSKFLIQLLQAVFP